MRQLQDELASRLNVNTIDEELDDVFKVHVEDIKDLENQYSGRTVAGASTSPRGLLSSGRDKSNRSSKLDPVKESSSDAPEAKPKLKSMKSEQIPQQDTKGKKTPNLLQPPVPAEATGESKGKMEMAAALGVKRILTNVKGAIQADAEAERLEMEQKLV